MTGSVNGNPMTDGLLMIGGVGASLQIAMILLARVLPHRANRRANITVGAIALAAITFFTATGSPDLDDMFFAVVEIATLLVIVRLAWRWRGAAIPVGPSGQAFVRTPTR